MPARIAFAIAILAFTLPAGCAGPVVNVAEPEQIYRRDAQRDLSTLNLPPGRSSMPYDELIPTVERVLPKLRKAAYAVCAETWGAVHGCQLMLSAQVHVFRENNTVNAFADRQNRVGIYAGLIRATGTDAELASVIAHELAHIMYGHGMQTGHNAAIGQIIGGLLGGAIAGRTGANQQQVTDSFMQAGAEVGARSYSRWMEIEADHMAAYILHRAGFPATGLRDFLVRMSRLQGAEGGFLATHPSDERRMAHALDSITRAKREVPVTWRQ